jgi:ribose transport system ATP-binding protein
MNRITAQPPLLQMKDISKSFDGVQVLRGVSLDVRPGSVKGLVGGNGSGKSTTMNILGGVLQRDAGTMELAGSAYNPSGPYDARKAGISFIHQELNLFPNLSIAENLSLESFPQVSGRWRVIDWRRVREVSTAALSAVGLSIAPDVEVSSLAPGEQQLVEIAKALIANPRLIIFDEPTTSLAAREIDRLFAIIRDLKMKGIGVIYISHALNDVRNICDEVVVLRDGAVAAQGDVASMTIDRIVSGMVGRSFEHVFPQREAGAQQGEPRLSVRGLTKKGIVRDVSFDLKPGEILGVCGLMGSGRSEVARMIFGLDDYDTGRMMLDGRPLPRRDPIGAIRSGIAFLTEDRRVEGLFLQQSIAWNIQLPELSKRGRALGGVNSRELERDAQYQVRRLNIKAASIHVPVATLSGGNQQKTVLAKWLKLFPSVLILDEPTRGIDIGAKVEIYALIDSLARSGMSVLLISSENEELLGLSDRILVMSEGEVVKSVVRGDEAFSDAGLMQMSIMTEGTR